MFKKPFGVKSCTNQRNSDKKKLLARLPVSVAFLPPKATFSLVRAASHSHGDVSLVFWEKEPLFFELAGDAALYPSLYLLWRLPAAVPVLLVHAPVLEYIANGADLMLQGVCIPEGWQVPEFSKDQAVSIGVFSPADGSVLGPVAVGRALMGSAEMRACGWKGRGVAVLHCLNDHLWEAGPKARPPSFPLADLLKPSGAEDSVPEEALDSLTIQDSVEASAEEPQETGPTPPSAEEIIAENDQKLKAMVLWTLKENLEQSGLPLDAGQFYALYVLKKLSPGVQLDLKKTSYKKFNTFLKKLNDQYDEPLIHVVNKKGVDSIVEVNFGHEAIQSAVAPEGVSNECSAPTSLKTRVAECFSATEAVMPLLTAFGFRRGDVVQPNQLREVLVKYATQKDLLRQNGKQVELDDLLQTLVRHFLPAAFPLNDLVQKVSALMTPAVLVTLPDGRQHVRRNKVPCISFQVEKRAGNKTVTLVNNFEFFGIDPKTLAHRVQNDVATGASLNSAAPNCDGAQLLIHGNHVNYVGELLQNEYAIQKKYIKGLELGVKQKKPKK